MDLSSINRRNKQRKHKRPYEYSTGNSNKYGVKVATHGHRVLPNGSIVVSFTPVFKTTTRR